MLRLLAHAVLLVGSISAAQADDGPVPTADAVLAGFMGLQGTAESRALFGLPPDSFWRPEGPLKIGLVVEGAEAMRPLLAQVAEVFAAASGQSITVGRGQALDLVSEGLLAAEPDADTILVIGDRQRLAQFAFDLGVHSDMLRRFELGTWPFVFYFSDGDLRRGVVLIARSEPPRAIEASMVLAVVWALGGVTLGPELQGLVDPEGKGPALTALGDAVFGLMGDPGLTPGMTLEAARTRAGEILAY